MCICVMYVACDTYVMCMCLMCVVCEMYMIRVTHVLCDTHGVCMNVCDVSGSPVPNHYLMMGSGWNGS